MFSTRIKFVAPAAAAAIGSMVYPKQAHCDIGGDWVRVRKDIVNLLDDEKYMEEPLGPLFVRLAWHSSGTYCKYTRTGGSDGATMRFNPEKSWGANAGLRRAQDILAPLREQHDVSFSDLWVFAGVVALEEMTNREMYVGFREGRDDKESGSECPAFTGETAPEGRLPSADTGGFEKTADHLRTVFYRMGFNDQEIVALSGAHALGRCHLENSGFVNPWTFSPTTFSNEFFKLLLPPNVWKEKKTHDGKPWSGPKQYEDKTGELMMLVSDMALVNDPKFKVWVEKYAADEELFFKDFAAAFRKLTELGVPFEARHGQRSPSTWFRRVNSVRTGIVIKH
eukprot:GEMP01012851.1.p1 GENE.GEMP01012851.1~~GEMP01012851.1.p1  ORF type:complete len:358 (+),score=85.70 GEMP01012851.1:61-1074(+)